MVKDLYAFQPLSHHTITLGDGPHVGQIKHLSNGISISWLNAYHALHKKYIEGAVCCPKHVYAL